LLLNNQDAPPLSLRNVSKHPLELLPLTAVYYLNGFGSSISSVLFEGNKDFTQVAITSNTTSIPRNAIDAGLLLQACGSNSTSDQDSLASEWIRGCFHSPEDVKINLSPKEYHSDLLVVLEMQLAGWGSKLAAGGWAEEREMRLFRKP